MTHTNSTLISIARRLRPRAEDFAAAAAPQDPNLLLQLRVAQARGERPSDTPAPAGR